ncbi:iron-containing redox enzyme family protein [Actinokineospora auranticolor]|uniref:Heme oxygenase-like protein n=1 Tax=Actinokineospora auranticolor TaxID=155976 RepID=A0A2S6GIE9_9PSEU|nr:iron-containing redox enzyme family protein [Actinokineospora auranticolor]PPK64963.1 heme oxygenase-like protein [Actinokineospora auranticolor]
MRVPHTRGELSAAVIRAFREPGSPFPTVRVDDPWRDADLQLALWICYELHYRGFDEVDPDLADDLDLLAFRRQLEQPWHEALRDLVPHRSTTHERVPEALAELVAADDGPPLASFLQRGATLEQFREFVVQRSIYHLKEADPHSLAIPRLEGQAKAAIIEIQADEYGGGRLSDMHSELFRATMRALDLDDRYGHFIDQASGETLAVNNLISFFGLHHRWTPALLGHLAAFEMTSSLPNRRYGNGLRRLGFDQAATRFYDEHVEADAVHEQIAAHDLCGSYARQHPTAAADIVFGAACALAVEANFGHHLLQRWQAPPASLAS